jgi:hypothetical protein
MSETERYTPHQMLAALVILGWSSGHLARRLKVREGTVRQMLGGKRNIPNQLGRWLDQCATIAQTMPALPDDWQGGLI